MSPHRYVEKYGDLRADEPGGPRSYHEIYWECSQCGHRLLKGCAPVFVAKLPPRESAISCETKEALSVLIAYVCIILTISGLSWVALILTGW